MSKDDTFIRDLYRDQVDAMKYLTENLGKPITFPPAPAHGRTFWLRYDEGE